MSAIFCTLLTKIYSRIKIVFDCILICLAFLKKYLSEMFIVRVQRQWYAAIN